MGKRIPLSILSLMMVCSGVAALSPHSVHAIEEGSWPLEGTDALHDYSFIVTSINPSKMTMRIYFSGVDEMRKEMGMPDYQYDIADLYIAQFDEGIIDWMYDESINNGLEDPYRHTMFIGLESVNGPSWLPTGQEIEIPMADFSSTGGKDVVVKYTDTTSYNYLVLHNLSGCLNSPDYEDGMECQVRFNENSRSLFYVPVALAEELIEEPAEEAYGGLMQDETDLAENDTIVTPKAPDTSAIQETVSRNDFLCWLIPLIIFSSLPVVWLFWPTSSKSLKKSKKSLDKSVRVR